MPRPGWLPLLLLAAAVPAAAQEWRLVGQLGRIDYQGALATEQDGASVVVGVTRVGLTEYLGVSAGLPLGEQQFWAAASASKRLPLPALRWLAIDLSAHGFAQRAPDSLSQPDPLPLPLPEAEPVEGWYVRGGGGQAALAISPRLGLAQLELRGGVAAQASSIAGERTATVLPTADGRLLLAVGGALLGPEAQQWGEDVTYAGGTARLLSGPVLLWGSAGKWVRGGPSDPVWSLGAAVEIAGGLRLEGGYRSAGYDPLYESRTAGSAALGASLRLGGAPPLIAPVPAAYRDGRAVIRLRARDARGTPSIAGDFTDWKPVPMTRSGDVFEVTIPVAPGVYSYAFVNEAGEWFVPESVPGRRSDGMGGWQAVLVIE